MITISDLRKIKKYCIDNGLVADAEIVADEQQLPGILSKKNANTMIIVIPSADSDSPDVDNITEVSQLLFFFVASISKLKENHSGFLDVMAMTQSTMNVVTSNFTQAVEDCEHSLHEIFHDFKPQWHIDPEYDLHGTHGWSLSMRL
jgi:hypothetical protein